MALQNEILLSALELFVNMTGVEHQDQLTEQIPSVEEYRERRKGSSTITVCVAITE